MRPRVDAVAAAPTSLQGAFAAARQFLDATAVAGSGVRPIGNCTLAMIPSTHASGGATAPAAFDTAALGDDEASSVRRTCQEVFAAVRGNVPNSSARPSRSNALPWGSRSSESSALVIPTTASADPQPYTNLAVADGVVTAPFSSTAFSLRPCEGSAPDDSAPPAVLGQPCFRRDHQAEVSYWVEAVLRQQLPPGHPNMFDIVPMYSQYIRDSSLDEVLADMVRSLRGYATLEITCEAAADLPANLGATTVLPWAVACEYAACLCGLPAHFVNDMFHALASSCLHQDIGSAPYARTAPGFITRGRWWATPTGDPNAGKSPTFAVLMKAFNEMIGECVASFPFPPPHYHVYSGGNHGGLNERLRGTNGVAAFVGPEAKPMLDPKFIISGVADPKSFVDLPRLLETASGGPYVWDTATEARAARTVAASDAARAAQASAPVDTLAAQQGAPRRGRGRGRAQGQGSVADEPASAAALSAPADPLHGRPLSFPSTNINLCVFQQFKLFRKWWVPTEEKEGLGFSARIIASFSNRAVLTREHGRRSEAPMTSLAKRLWAGVATNAGHGSRGEALAPFGYSPAGEACFQEAYHLIAEVESGARWSSAMKAMFGKFEYWTPTVSLLTTLFENTLSPSRAASKQLSDNALKCGLRFLDARLALGCCVVDTEVKAYVERALPRQGQREQPAASAAPRCETEELRARVLRVCNENPITYTTLARHFTHYRSTDSSGERRFAILQDLVSTGFGWLQVARARGTSAITAPAVHFHRYRLTDTIRSGLQQLNLREEDFKPAEDALDPASDLPSTAFVPDMVGGGLPQARLHDGQRCGQAALGPQRVDWYAQEEMAKRCPLPLDGMTSVDISRSGMLASVPAMCGGAAKAKPKAKAVAAAAKVIAKAGAKAVAKAKGKAKAVMKAPHKGRGKGKFGAANSPLTVHSSDIHQPGFANPTVFRKHVKTWAASLVPGQELRCNAALRPSVGNFWRCRVYCTSCSTCASSGGGNGWHAIVTYDTVTKELIKDATPTESHGDYSNVGKWSQVTATTEGALKRRLAQPGSCTTQDLIKLAQEQQHRTPDETWLRTFAKNHRPRRDGEAPAPSAHGWCEADWRQLERSTPSFDAVAHEAPNQLCIVDACYDPAHTIMVFCNPGLARAILQRLANKEYVKLCGDGTYRLVREAWTLLSLGFLTKHYACGEQDRMPAFRTTFTEFVYAFANKESDKVRVFITDTLCELLPAFH